LAEIISTRRGLRDHALAAVEPEGGGAQAALRSNLDSVHTIVVIDAEAVVKDNSCTIQIREPNEPLAASRIVHSRSLCPSGMAAMNGRALLQSAAPVIARYSGIGRALAFSYGEFIWFDYR
jgi:hypothetical protein